jgi:putative Ca2+/H+ antiporter (TMEM165/GDT1 family)
VGVFAAASAALVSSTLLAVLLGGQVARFVSPLMLRAVAAVGFIALGIWMLFGGRS